MRKILFLLLCVVVVGCVDVPQLGSDEKYKLKITVETKELPAHFKHHTLRFTITGPDGYKNTVTTISLNELNRLKNLLYTENCGEYYKSDPSHYQGDYKWFKFRKSDIQDEIKKDGCDYIKIEYAGWIPRNRFIFYSDVDIYADLRKKIEARVKDGSRSR